MQDKVSADEFYHRAKKVREIAKCIYDKGERRVLLKFVRDSEKLAAKALGTLKSS